MREIKFRVWNKNENKFEDSSGYAIGAAKGVLLELGAGYFCGADDFLEVQQYTGLKDIHEKEIYEGDIVYFRVENQISGGWIGPNRGVIRWVEDYAAFLIQIEKDEDALHESYVSINRGYDAYSNSMEILGNVFQNPELLEVKNAHE